jgi:ubiquitin carboxyl-terminal hydrolase 14
MAVKTAIVTHKGAAADAGHYMGFVKKSVFHASKAVPEVTGGAGATASGSMMNISAPSGGAAVGIDEDDEDWYKFDDDKVSVFPKEKLGTLDGGGKGVFLYCILVLY